ncbi:FixH family protein [Paenisporosarcina sp. TG20]|uniref:FixH family protein n=1 Tax=Paenisporosarcina sp. TG20 TaxID=1211706 RepID=UPI0002FB22DA|nr:FixH family protein [Paenisporosarcina sp. TG20]
MKQFFLIGSILGAILLSACGVTEEPIKTTSDEVPEMVEVDLTVPQTAILGEEITFTAAVTQGQEIVEDADEVMFEVKNTISGEKEMIEASLNDDKHYAINYSFETTGTYDITSHVAARNLHVMPTKQIIVTDGDEDSETNETPAHGDTHHHDQAATIEFTEGTTTVGKATLLVTNVSLSGTPLEGARVRYDISREGDDHHAWLEVSELEAGTYQTEFTFTELGTYEIEIHVTKGDDLHEHVIKTYLVE